MPHHVCNVTSVFVSFHVHCAYTGKIIKIQEPDYQNISLQKHHRIPLKYGSSVATFQTFLNFCVSITFLSFHWSVLHHRLITSLSKMGMHVLIKLCSVVEFKLTSYEMGERKEELVITVIIRVLSVPCPLPLSPVTFTSEPKCHISMPETQSHSGIMLTALILPIDLPFRQNSRFHHGLCISSPFVSLKQCSDRQ